tara:strand:- start:243 stop:824 length:582 start_codon:yes stop_codon:yes gene_type:complete
MPRKINHSRRILSKNIISKSEIAPGMILDFRYNNPKAYDKNPLVLFIYKERTANNVLLHCLNLNYLYEKDVQSIFNSISKLVDLEIDYNDNQEPYTQINLEKNSKSNTGVTGKTLYEQIVKPKIFSINRTKNCYRTYNMKKVQSLNLISYRFDTIEKKIREQTKLSKYRVKTNELFKNIEEQAVNIKTDNTKK